MVVGSVLAGVLGWYFTRGDDSLGGPYKKQAVATDNKQCSEIGNKILNSNGSAVDAAIAAMFCLGVINMQSSGVGGGGVMLVYNRKLKKAKVIDFKGTAPALTSRGMFTPVESRKNMSIYGKCYFSFPFCPRRDLAQKAKSRGGILESSTLGKLLQGRQRLICFHRTKLGKTCLNEVCCVLFSSVICDNQKKIREESHVHNVYCSNRVRSPCDHSSR